MPDKIELFKCVLCKKDHKTWNQACLCEHSHISIIRENEDVIEEVRILGRIYKPVEEKTEESQRWFPAMQKLFEETAVFG
jgi:hypothetical protein